MSLTGTERAVRNHYTLVCQCEYTDDADFDERTSTNADCVMHGDMPDPLVALLAEVGQLRGALKEIAEFDIGVRLAPVAACKEIARVALGGDDA